jgi:hypothetical protein
MDTTTTRGPDVVIKIPEAGAGVRVIGLQPDEFLFPGSKVSVDTDVPMDRVFALRAIGVAKGDGSVKLSKEGKRATWSPPEDLAAGRHVLQIGPLIAESGREITSGVSLPFQFVPSATPIPRGVAIESMVRLRVERGGIRRLPLDTTVRGAYLELVKGTDRRTGRPVALAFDETGKQVDADRLLGDLEAARAKRLGKLHEDLFERLQQAAPDEWIQVAIWALVEDDISATDKRELERVDAEPQQPRAAAARAKNILERARAVARIAEEAGGREVRVDELAPVVFARLQKSAIRKLARRDEVAGVFFYDPKGIEDLDDSIDVANSDDVHAAGVEGGGVKVAVWEDGPASTANLVIEASFSASPATTNHSQHVHGIIKNNEANEPHGHAPDCRLHSANTTDLAALSWAVRDRGCTVINQSFHRSSEPKSGSLSFDDIYKDWLILHWPYPTILQAAGNFWNGDPDNVTPPSSEFVNHKGYNSMAVANHDDSAGAISSSSVFRNPTTTHNDRELPEIAANGTSVTTVGLTMSGTSMASPAAVGVAALLQNAAPTLKAWPEGCRAILLGGSTRNVVGDTWWQDVVDDDDASDGSGAVNALESYRISQSRRGRNAAASRRGWDVGTLTSSDFDANGMSQFAYRIQVPSLWFGPRHVKVALAWNSMVSTFSFFGITIPVKSKLTLDLDLKVFDSSGTQVGYSGSWDNSYEVAEFDAIPGETYDIKIRRWSGTDWTWYGIAWTVTGGFLDLLGLRRLGNRELARVSETLLTLAE